MLVDAEPSTIGWLQQFLIVSPGNKGEPQGHCEACGDAIWSRGAYRIPRLAGLYCGVFCIEAKLFGLNHCRWCGERIDKPYLSVDSRLCSDDCSESYYAHVLGDHTAELGTGKRFLLWIAANQPSIYRQLLGQGRIPSSHCQNPQCPNGKNGQTASLAHFRAGTLYCSEACSEQARRNTPSERVLTGVFDPSQTPVLRGFSRHVSPGKAFRVKQTVFAR